MIVSTARILASQANGKKSRGPTTPEGKAVSRANSYKHGMTGAGVVLPEEDLTEVGQRFEELQAQFNPSTPMGKILVHRIALCSVRLERSAEHEAAYLGEKIRHARADHDERRQVEIASLLDDLARQPAASVGKLLRSPDGIDALIGAWEGLRADLDRPGLGVWSSVHDDRAHHLSGRRVEEIPISRIHELSTAIRGDFSLLREGEGAGLDVEARRAWARDRLIEYIDEELTALGDCLGGIDRESWEQDREEAPKRALFDISKAAVLARRYEAANERGMFRALNDLRKVEKEAAENPIKPSPACPVGPLGSFGPASEPTDDLVEEFEAEAKTLAIEGFIGGLTSIPASNRVEFGQLSAISGGREGRFEPLLAGK